MNNVEFEPGNRVGVDPRRSYWVSTWGVRGTVVRGHREGRELVWVLLDGHTVARPVARSALRHLSAVERLAELVGSGADGHPLLSG